MASKKWTLAEGIQKLLPMDAEGTPEINDLGTPKRDLCLDVSFADVSSEDGTFLSVIVTVGEGLEEDDYINMAGTAEAKEGETLQELAVRVANMFGIHPDECIWQNGETM
jgi:hypothetical protein